MHRLEINLVLHLMGLFKLMIIYLFIYLYFFVHPRAISHGPGHDRKRYQSTISRFTLGLGLEIVFKHIFK